MGTMDHGIYYNLPEKTYHAISDAVGQSTAQGYLKSPAHARVRRDFAGADFGSAAHSLILPHSKEASEGQVQVCILPDLDLRFKAGKETKAAIVEANPGKIILTHEEGQTLEAMKAAVYGHKTASELFERVTATEVTIIFPFGGVKCKARLDAITSDDIILDLKTTKDASFEGFGKSVANFGYAGQCAMYCEAFEWAFKRKPKKFVFIPVEKEPPFGVACYQLDKEAQTHGRKRILKALEIYALCKQYDSYPCYPDSLQTLKLPSWALKSPEIIGDATEW